MSNSRNLIIWAGILLAAFLLFSFMRQASNGAGPADIKVTEFKDRAARGEFDTVVIKGNRDINVATGFDGSSALYETKVLNVVGFEEAMEASGVEIANDVLEQGNGFMAILSSLLPIALLIGFWFFMFRQMGGGGRGGAMGFGKSKAKLLNQDTTRVTFDDVAGVEEAKQDVEEIVEFLRDPQKFERLGAKIPKGVLMVGPPGTGKTLLAKAIAGEANVPFFSISGSDFVEMFVGVGASRVRDMFEQARKNAPCIIFIDEIDAVGRARSQGMSGGHEEREQTLNQMLVEMDGFEGNEGVIIIAATNRVDILDKALLRPGRFDRQVQVNLPDSLGREKILKVHAKKVPLGPDVDLKRLAKGMPMYSGADLANVINEAALLAARANKRVVTMGDFENAKDKVSMGPERRSMLQSKEQIELVAYHEAGHAIAGLNVPSLEKLNKVTIIPRGNAGGYAQYTPEEHMPRRREHMKARLVTAFGGRAAEEIIYGDEGVTGGASGDIRQATAIARQMVEELGFSERLGHLYYGRSGFDPYMGPTKEVSEQAAAIIEEETRDLVEWALSEARRILNENVDALHRLKEALIEHETLSAEEVERVVAGEALHREQLEADDEDSGSGSGSGFLPQVGAGGFAGAGKASPEGDAPTTAFEQDGK